MEALNINETNVVAPRGFGQQTCFPQPAAWFAVGSADDPRLSPAAGQPSVPYTL